MRFLFPIGLALSLLACQIKTSSPKNGSKGITVLEEGLAAGRVYLSDSNEETDNRTFRYGQKIYTNFVDMQGFIVEGGKIFPQMHLFVLSKRGDTLLRQYDLFGDAFEGIDANEPAMNSHLILARPIYSGATHSLQLVVRDAKGPGRMSTSMDFELIPDPTIKVVSNGLTYSEAYVYSEDRDVVLQDGMFSFFENLRFDIQDLDGYVLKDGAIHLGMAVKVIDNENNEILNQPDVFEHPIMDEALLKQGLSATLIVREGQVANPLKWQVRIWDKNSEAKLRAQAQISVKQ